MALVAIITFGLSFTACKSGQQTQTTTPTPTPRKGEVKVREYTGQKEHTQVKLNANLSGQYSLDHVSVFAQPEDIPQYKKGEVIYHFNEANNTLKIVKNRAVPKDFSPASGDHQFWLNDCLFTMGGGRLYLLELSENEFNGKHRVSLSLDTNINPSISNDGPVFHFTKIAN